MDYGGGYLDEYFAYLANRLRYPSYLSLEYVLSLKGFIPESVFSYTSVAVKSPRIYTTPVGKFIFRNIKSSLFGGFDEKESQIKGCPETILIAPLSKALFDFLYLKPTPKEGLKKIRIKKHSLFMESFKRGGSGLYFKFRL